QDHDGLWIRGEDGFRQLLLLESEGLAVDGLFAVAGQRTLGPPGIAGWMIADDDYRDVGFTCQICRRCIVGAVKICNLRSLSSASANSRQRRDGKRRRSAVPVERNLVRQRPDHGDAL